MYKTLKSQQKMYKIFCILRSIDITKIIARFMGISSAEKGVQDFRLVADPSYNSADTY